jgi:hypothetical protein
MTIPGARPANQVIEAAAQADRVRADGLADEHLVTLRLARRVLAGEAGDATPGRHGVRCRVRHGSDQALSDLNAAISDVIQLSARNGAMPYREGMDDDHADDVMINTDTLKFELHGRLDDLLPVVGKTHLSVRWEPSARIVRLGVCIDRFTWDHRMAVLDRLLAFEADHSDDFALEFDIVPLQSVEDPSFAAV